MSALASTTLLVGIVVVVLLSAWWRSVLKFLALSVIILTSVGTVEVVAAVIQGVSPD